MINHLFKILLLMFASLLFAQTNEAILRNAYDRLYDNPQEAINLADKLIEKSTYGDDLLTAYIIKINGYSSLNDTRNSLTYAFEAYELAKKKNDLASEIRILGVIGEQFQNNHINDYARTYLDKAQDLIKKSTFTSEKKQLYLGNIYAVKGNSYKDDFDCNFGIEYYDKSIETYKEMENQSTVNNLCLVYLEKSTCLLDQSKLDLADKYITKAMNLAKKNNIKEYVLEAQLNRSELLLLQNKPIESIKLLAVVMDGIDALEELYYKDEVNYLLTQNYYLLGDLGNYEKYSRELLKTRTELKLVNENSYNESLNFILSQKDKTKISWFIYALPFFLFILLVGILFKKF